MSAIQADIEARLAEVEPEVEVLLAEVVGGRLVRVFIDHPDGVSLELCERVTELLPEVRERYALEVSSPGPERPLSKPDHFRRFVGRRARVRTRGRHDGRRASPASCSTPPTTRSPSPPTPAWCRSPTPTSTVRTSWETERMSQEIVEAVRALAREKGISEEKLITALEDALLSATRSSPAPCATPACTRPRPR